MPKCALVVINNNFLFHLHTLYMYMYMYSQHTEQRKCPRAPVVLGVSFLMTVMVHLFRTTVNATSTEVIKLHAHVCHVHCMCICTGLSIILKAGEGMLTWPVGAVAQWLVATLVPPSHSPPQLAY